MPPHTYPDNTNLPSQPNQFSPEEYKAHYVDLEDDNVQPFDKVAQYQTYAVRADAFGASHNRQPSMSTLQQKQSYLSEYTYSGKDTEESVTFPPPRIVPMKQQKEVDTRTFWQKVRVLQFFPTTDFDPYEGLAGINCLPPICHYCPCSDHHRPCYRR